MGITEFLVEHITHWISVAGYPGIGVLMALESMVAPVPSEAVMPFAGWLIVAPQGPHHFTLTGVTIASTIGSIIGSLLSYAMGYWGGRPVVVHFGKFLLLNVHDLEVTERFFGKYGNKTVFIARFIPVIRHLISIPAGMGKMHLVPFCIYTVIGAGLWNLFLAWLGIRLQEHWTVIRKYTEVVDVVVLILLAAGLAYFVYAHVMRLRQASKPQ
jgi:membrane protein DedA with SNARE-associated domain